MGYNVFCSKHLTYHNLTVENLKRLVHIYQYMSADFAFSPPLVETEYSNADIVLGKIWCPVEDLRVTDGDAPSRVREYVTFMTRVRRRLRKTSRNTK